MGIYRSCLFLFTVKKGATFRVSMYYLDDIQFTASTL